MDTAIAILAALALDRLFGEPRRWHPLVGFGGLAQLVESLLNTQGAGDSLLKMRGALALALLTVPPTAIVAYVAYRYDAYLVVEILALYLALGARSLFEHAQHIADALLLKRTDEARLCTSYLVSRDTAKMDEKDMSRAAIESTLENGNDALFAPLFWFAIGGAPTVVFYRLCNTLDAMWGYRTARFLHFGWAAARLDDVLNYLPARLTALTYACLGHFQAALHCWRTQAGRCKSPNAGPVMSSGAGALALQLGGPTVYHGKLETCPLLGCGAPPLAGDIAQAIRLVQRGMLLWASVAVVVAGVCWGASLA